MLSDLHSFTMGFHVLKVIDLKEFGNQMGFMKRNSFPRNQFFDNVFLLKSLRVISIFLVLYMIFFRNALNTSRRNETTYNPQRLIQYENGTTQKVSESYKLLLKFLNYRFFDITDSRMEDNFDRSTSSLFILNKRDINDLTSFPNKIWQKKEILSKFERIDQKFLKDQVINISKFYTRYYNSELGLQFSEWFHDEIITNLINEGKIINHDKNEIDPVFKDRIRVEKFYHSWRQFSIIVTILGDSTKKIKDTVVLGSHIDSTNLLFPNILSARGADDDASGVLACLMALKILVDSMRTKKHHRLKNDIQFHFYSGEEGGFLGSQDIFDKITNSKEYQNIKLRSMVQLDQIGFSGTNIRTQNKESKIIRPLIGVITDHTDSKLTEYLKLLIREYCYNGEIDEKGQFFIESQCGYACSDNAAAEKYGVASGLLTESKYKEINKFVHSSWDTIDRLDFDFIEEFVKVAISYIFELGYYEW